MTGSPFLVRPESCICSESCYAFHSSRLVGLAHIRALRIAPAVSLRALWPRLHLHSGGFYTVCHTPSIELCRACQSTPSLDFRFCRFRSSYYSLSANNRMEHNAADARQFGYWFADSRLSFFAPHGSCGALGLFVVLPVVLVVELRGELDVVVGFDVGLLFR